jgi:hypothetical protein
MLPTPCEVKDNSGMAPGPSPSRRAVLSGDTDLESERLQISLWRRMAAAAKLRSVANASIATLDLSIAGIRLRHPRTSPAERFLALAGIRLGAPLAQRIYGSSARLDAADPTSMDPVGVAIRVAGVLARCGVSYVIGGSLASSISGEPRSTLDVDMMIDITEPAIPCVIRGLGQEFHADADAFVRAIRHRSSVNVIHLPSATKVDLFIMGATPLEPRQMQRRRRIQIADRPGEELYVYTPEDILLQKLRWYKLGGEVSDRQWRDVLGILAVQEDDLDLLYLRDSAREIDVRELLDRALAEAGRTE